MCGKFQTVKRRTARLLALLLAAILALGGTAVFADDTGGAGASPRQEGPTVPEKPADFYVYDGASVLTAETEKAILDRASSLDSRYGIQIVIMTVTTIGNADQSAYRQYTEDIYSGWQLGGAQDLGALLVLFTGDEMYDAVAGNLGPSFTSAGLTELHRTYTEPKFAQGDYDGAALDFFNAAADAAESYVSGTPVSGGTAVEPTADPNAAGAAGPTAAAKVTPAPGEGGAEKEGNPVLGFLSGLLTFVLVLAAIAAVLLLVIYVHGQMVRKKRRAARAARRNRAGASGTRRPDPSARRRSREDAPRISNDDYRSFSDRY